MSTQGDKIVAKAKSFLGQHEAPMGSNRGPLPDRALKFVKMKLGVSWCAAFACLVAYLAGVKNGPRTASSGAIYAWGNDHGMIIYDPLDDTDKGGPHAAQPGDFGLVIDESSPTDYEHTCILEAPVEGSEGAKWHTIDGNWGNKVSSDVKDIHGLTIVRPYVEG